MKLSRCITLLVVALSLLAVPAVSIAKDEVGNIVALRGKAVIERDSRARDAKVKDGILLKDSVSTLEASRAKLLFTDDSVLSMGEKSKVVIKEFLFTKEKGGKSIFNLIDGKMKTVLGKTQFEVRTPTAVAAARGTILLYHVRKINGKICSLVIPTETKKEVMVTSSDSAIKGRRAVKPWFKVDVCEGEAIANPSPASRAEVEELLKDTDVAEIRV